MFSLCFVLCLSFGQPPKLADRLQPLIAGHKGKVAVAIIHLKTGDTFFHNADEPMPTASLIKAAILVEAYLQAEEKKIDLNKTLTLRKEDKVPGSGILTPHFSNGATFCLRDAVRLMIVFSDNTATNLVLDNVGIASVNERMTKLGFSNTKINAKVFRGSVSSVDPERTKKFGLGSTTARESAELFRMLAEDKLGTPALCATMRDILQECDDKEMFARRLPAKLRLIHKTGAVSNARTSAGVIYHPSGPIALCVLTDQNEDKSWSIDNAAHVLCARIAEEVVTHFDQRMKGTSP